MKITKQNGTATKSDFKKEHVLKAWRETNGNISKLCQKAGINRKTFYEWIKNEAFANQIREQEEKLNDDIRDRLIELALKGNMRAIIYYLEHKHPEFMSKGDTFSLTVPTPILGGISREPMSVEFVEDKNTNNAA